MTPEQALQCLDNLVSQIRLSRADHVQAQQAAAVLARAIAPEPEPAKKDGQANEE